LGLSGIYDAVAPAALWSFRRRSIDHRKGVIITLQGLEAGMEFAANRSGIRISLQ
jgi:hypothetical protein